MARVLIIGKTSFLARQYLDWLTGQGETLPVAVSHREIVGPDDLAGYDVIVPFALDPRMKTEPYDPAFDLEARVARWAAYGTAHMVMVSTRMVYGPATQWQAREDAVLMPVNAYGRNKAQAEEGVAAALGARATILRLSNIVGFEYPEPGRRTFMAMVLGRLKREGFVQYDMDPGRQRDFLPFPDFARILHTMITARPGGVYNAGSGIPLPTGKIAENVIAGYGAGRLVVEDTGKTDEFVLDMTKTTAFLGHDLAADPEMWCRDLGRTLANAP